MFTTAILTTTEVEHARFREFAVMHGAEMNAYGELVIENSQRHGQRGGIILNFFTDINEAYPGYEDILQAHFDAPIKTIVEIHSTSNANGLNREFARKFIAEFGGLFEDGSPGTRLEKLE